LNILARHEQIAGKSARWTAVPKEGSGGVRYKYGENERIKKGREMLKEGGTFNGGMSPTP